MPGWPETADLFDGRELSYCFVRGRAMGCLSLSTGSGTLARAGEELGAVLDIVTENLTVP